MTPLFPLPRALRRAASAVALLALVGGAADAQTVSLSAADTGVDEGGSTTLTVTRSGSTAGAVTVEVGFGSGSTAAAGEVSLSPTSLTIPAGQTAATTTLSASEDTDTVDESVVVEIRSAQGASVGTPRSVTLAVRDNDVPRVTLEVGGGTSNLTVDEGGQTTITARLSRAASERVDIQLATTGDTDAFSVNPLTVQIPAGQTSGTATLRAAEDADTADETVTVSINGVSGGGAVANGAQTRTITIRDNDGGATPLVTLAASPTTIAEAGGTATVTVRLSRRASAATTVSLSATGGDGDVTLSASSVTIPADATQAQVTLTSQNDADFNDERVTVEVTGVSGSNARESGEQSVAVTVTDDDNAPVTLTANDGFINEGEFSVLTVALPAGAVASAPVTVSLAYAVEDNDGDDTDGADRSDFRAPNQIVIRAGQNAATDTLFAVQDDVFEGVTDVTVSIAGVAGRGVESGDQAVTVQIANDDVRPTVTFEASPNVIGARGGTSTLTVALTNPTDEDVTVTLSYFGSAGRGSDYTAPSQITVEAGDLTGTGRLETLGGGGGRQVLVQATSVVDNAATLAADQEAFISFNSDLDRATVAFADTSATVDEGDGPFTLRLRLSEALDAPATVTVTRTGGAAGDLGGFDEQDVRIPAGATTASLSVPVTDDALREGDETFTFALSTDDGARLRVDDGTFTLTVTDDDDATDLVVNEVDSIVGAGADRFVELLSAGGGGATDDLAVVFYRADSTVIRSVSLDGLATEDDGLLVLDGGSFDVPDAFRGVAVVRGDGPLRGSLFDEDDEDVLDAVFFDEQAAADQRNRVDQTDVEASEGSLQRRDDGLFAFAAPPTPGEENVQGSAVPTQPGPVAQRVGDVFPNPSAGRATVAFAVAAAQRVRVSVYDALGREVAVLVDGARGVGAHAVSFGAGLGGGVYVVRLSVGGEVASGRVTLVR